MTNILGLVFLKNIVRNGRVSWKFLRIWNSEAFSKVFFMYNGSIFF